MFSDCFYIKKRFCRITLNGIPRCYNRKADEMIAGGLIMIYLKLNCGSC